MDVQNVEDYTTGQPLAVMPLVSNKSSINRGYVSIAIVIVKK